MGGAMARIVIADDEPSHLDLVATILERAGHDVVTFGSGTSCLDYLNEQSADMVISDIYMPGMDGLQLMAELSRRGLAIPLVAMTGGMRGRFGPASDVVTRLGAYAVLTKPFTPAQLLDAVGDCLRGRH